MAGILSDLKDKISDRENSAFLSLDDVEFRLPLSGRRIRLGGSFKMDRLKIGFGEKKKGGEKNR